MARFEFSQLPERQRVAFILAYFLDADEDTLLDFVDTVTPFIRTNFLDPFAAATPDPDEIDPVSGLNETDLADREHGG